MPPDRLTGPPPATTTRSVTASPWRPKAFMRAASTRRDGLAHRVPRPRRAPPAGPFLHPPKRPDEQIGKSDAAFSDIGLSQSGVGTHGIDNLDPRLCQTPGQDQRISQAKLKPCPATGCKACAALPITTKMRFKRGGCTVQPQRKTLARIHRHKAPGAMSEMELKGGLKFRRQASSSSRRCSRDTHTSNRRLARAKAATLDLRE